MCGSPGWARGTTRASQGARSDPEKPRRVTSKRSCGGESQAANEAHVREPPGMNVVAVAGWPSGTISGTGRWSTGSIFRLPVLALPCADLGRQVPRQGPAAIRVQAAAVTPTTMPSSKAGSAFQDGSDPPEGTVASTTSRMRPSNGWAWLTPQRLLKPYGYLRPSEIQAVSPRRPHRYPQAHSRN